MGTNDAYDGDTVAKDTGKPCRNVGIFVGVGDSGVVAPKRKEGVEGVDLHEAHSANEKDDANDPVRQQEHVEPLLDAFRFELLHSFFLLTMLVNDFLLFFSFVVFFPI